jgi:Chlorophyll A-B binding protein
MKIWLPSPSFLFKHRRPPTFVRFKLPCNCFTMKLAVCAILASTAAAFAPASQKASSKTALNAVIDLSDKVGGLPPLGPWDPLGLSTSDATFDQYRACELKNGRVAMMAVLGYVIPEIYRFPGDIAPGLKFADVPNGIAALSAVPTLGWLQIFFLIGAVDYYGFLGDFEIGKPNLEGSTLIRRQTMELQNGRLAMLAVAELFRHDSQNLVVPDFDGYDKLITGLPFLY